MDITVSRLNERMALRVPSELPLGLVFIVGQVEAIQPYPPDPDAVTLELVDGNHRLPCELPHQVVDEMQLVGQERVRAGGQLVFDTRDARYHLLARDIEVLPPLAQSDAEMVVRSTEAAVQERNEGPHLAAGELPPWVRQLAPPEVQSEFNQESQRKPAGDSVQGSQAPPLSPALVDYLSQAIDSDQEIELTSDLVQEVLDRRPAHPVEESDGVRDGGTGQQVSPPEITDGAPMDAAGTDAMIDDGAGTAQTGVTDSSWDVALPTDVESEQEKRQGVQRRQMLLLVAGVFALFFLVLLVFVAIALAAGYTPFLLP
jgi:hypothetical protein